MRCMKELTIQSLPLTQIVHPGSIIDSLAPLAFQVYARDFYVAYRGHRPKSKFSPARLFLLGRSIELAGKALHLGQGKTAEDIRKINHDLQAACDYAVLSVYGITMTTGEHTELKRANVYYAKKGFEYFLFNLTGVAENRS